MVKEYDPKESFRQEARDLIEQLEEGLIRIEAGDASSDAINEVFRAMHTLKGSGSMFGFDDLASFTHHFESAFDLMRQGKLSFSPALIDLSFQSVDHIKALMEDRSNTVQGESIIAQLSEFNPSAGAVNLVSSGQHEKESNTDVKEYRIIFYPEPSFLQHGANPALLLDELRELGQVTVKPLLDRLPPLSQLDPCYFYIGWSIDIKTAAGEDELRSVFMFHEEGSILIIEETGTDNQKDSNVQNDNQEAAISQASTSTVIKIPSGKLDTMMDQVRAGYYAVTPG